MPSTNTSDDVANTADGLYDPGGVYRIFHDNRTSPSAAAYPQIFITHFDAVIKGDDRIPELNANCALSEVAPSNGTGANVVVTDCVLIPVSEMFRVGDIKKKSGLIVTDSDG